MHRRTFRTVLLSLFLLGTAFATVAKAGEAEGLESAPSQTPVQVVVQVVLTAIALRILNRLDLP